MKLKLDENGNVVVKDGMPVYVYDDGKEVPFNAPEAVSKISALNKEAQGHREAKETAEGRLKLFEGLEDPEAAKKALETVANLDSGKLLTAGKVDEIKAAARKAADDQLTAAQKNHALELQKLTDEKAKISNMYEAELIGGSFNRSKFIAEKIAIPSDMLRATFERQFRIEDGKVVAYDKAGTKIFSRTRPGDLAEFEEALELIVDQYPNKDQILKGTVKNGGGAADDPASKGKQPGKWDGSLQERAAAVASRFPGLSTG